MKNLNKGLKLEEMEENDYASGKIIKVSPPKKSEIRMIRFLITCGIISMVIFIIWFMDPDHIGYAPLYYILTFALFFKLLKMAHEWYHYWSVSIPKMPIWKTKYTVDILTTACPGEPKEMIIRTLKKMKAIAYPHTNYLCDEGDDPELKKVCSDLGIIHVTRKVKIDAKAGNINNALKQATGDICVVLDPDHEPIPEFLDRVLPYFEDPEIGFVQCVQAYGNQAESFIAKGAAEQTYHFYGPMMMSMNSYGTVQVIGANCTFRRKALDSIGGHAAGLAEDMHTSMQLNAKGWKSVYVPEILTRGLVPATLSAYYKQQLKWSRGAFELLFRTYPSIFRKLNWRQKLHFLTIPLYFLFGLINFFDIIVPLTALCFAEVPWAVNIDHFILIFAPLFGLSLFIRLYAQRWLLEKHERGFHLAGGILLTASWWVLLIGFIYAIFNIKVPYIPTPKEDVHENYWKLCLPNILITVLCAAGTWYGLSIDWSPYSIAMASYGIMNSAMLSFIILMSQQRFLLSMKKKIKNISLLNNIRNWIRISTLKTQHKLYGVLRNGAVSVIVVTALVFISFGNLRNEKVLSVSQQKEFGGFYSGITFSEDGNLKTINSIGMSNKVMFDVISFKHQWDNKSLNFFKEYKQAEGKNVAIPLIVWEPVLDLPEQKKPENYNVYSSISDGLYDKYLTQYATALRNYKEPVFISFAAGFDDPLNSWSLSGKNSPEDFQVAWRYIYTFFNNLGISNVTWVWSPTYANAVAYYPGPVFVDWIGVSCLNYGKRLKDRDWYSFSEIYLPFRNKLGAFQKPFMITEFGTLNGPDQSHWINKAFTDIKENFKEIRSVIIQNNKKNIFIRDKETNNLELHTANFSFSKPDVQLELTINLNQKPFCKKPFIKSNFSCLAVNNKLYKTDFIKGSPGRFSLVVNNKSVYIRGVAYNTGHDWRDGNMPLTRQQVEKDFEKIKAMGANTIRRYGHGIYDRNVLNIAEEYDLKVVYGFWFDPKIDYYSDTNKIIKYIHDIEEKVILFKGHPAVLAWSLGNEAWGLLKHTYAKPYLTKVRLHYVKLIEFLAQRIHELDPDHPVFSCIEHEEYQLPGELASLHDGAPSVDVIGVNSYYKGQISKLNHVAWQFDSLRPYLVSEFGPKGYWDPKYNRTAGGMLKEDSENEKAEWYKEQWSNYVLAYKGYNIGGFAYCWHDRMEGSYTWFGLTDYKGRLKPAYYALKELWTNKKSESLPQFEINGPVTFTPGKEYAFKATSSLSKNKELNYEWNLFKNDYMARVDNIGYTDETGSSVIVKIPKEISKYRLYLHVSDKEGNVSTASVPIEIK